MAVFCLFFSTRPEVLAKPLLQEIAKEGKADGEDI